jgi:hypothetical protein
MFTCGWCGKHYQSWKNQCDSCGGRMPAPPGTELGPEPPPAPRKLPEGFALRVRLTRNFPLMAGLAFTILGGGMTAAMIGLKTWAALFPAFFFLGGIGMVRVGIQEASRTLDAFRNGRAVRGKVACVREDKQTAVNDRHPWDIIYTFEEGGHAYEGKMSTFESATANRFRGGLPVWVLVVDGVPERNTLYPPIR